MSRAIPAVERWGVMWMEKSGPKCLTVECGVLQLFTTKRKAQTYISERWGYIKTRPDLRSAPHFWRMPQPVKVRVTPVIQQRKRGRS